MKNEHENEQHFFYCKKCDYKCSKKYNWDRHILTAKHKMDNMDKLMDNQKRAAKKFACVCGKKYVHLSGLSKHKKICKSTSVLFPNVSKCFQNVSKFYFCECGKKYKTRSGFYKHKKICKYHQNVGSDKNNSEIVPTNNVENLLKSILDKNTEILKENQVLREKISTLELGNTYNNTQNNQFNINMFLNEKCKNAMNLEDFIEKIKLTLEDLQYTNKNGYTDGISNIFIKNLNDMDVTERPIHCSDQKRLQFYVKNADEWSKDKNNEKLDSSIQQVSQKQLRSVNEWTRANPDFMENDKKREEYMELVNKAIQPNNKKNLRSIKRKLGENVKLQKD
jgi:hypothetical protein